MFRKSGGMFALAGASIVAGFLMLSGCDSGQETATVENRNPRNELNKASMDYMRQQYESKQKKK